MTIELNQDVPQEIQDARSNYTVVKVHAPHLDDDLRPDIHLLNMPCPFGRDGHCAKCESFAGLYSPEGTVFAHGSYEGYCKGEPA
jgi:hypothetical protein